MIVASLALGALPSVAEPGRRVQSLDFDWRFHLGEVPGAEQTTFSDQTWRMLDVPHDWSIEGPFDRANPGGTFFGFLPGGVGWYRREIQIGADERDRKVFVEFDGIYENSEVWINGVSLGRQGFGYTSFQRDLTPHLRFDSPNQLAVRVENLGQPNSRWYTGSGIYRHVRLVTKQRLHIDRHGVYVTTPQVTAESALVRVRTTLRNQRPDAKSIRLATRVLDSDGRELARTTSLHDLPTGANADLTQDLVVPRPSFWSPDTPVLYALESRVLDGGTVMDSVTTSFGIRTFAFDKDRGFILNDVLTKLKGVCMHHDAGAVGVAVPVDVWERRLRVLKEMGCNAIRAGHHPPAPEFIDLCDRLGFLFINEAFDKWSWGPGGYWKDISRHFAANWRADLVEMLRRDRNHPSLILWSVGNENGVVWDTPIFETYRKLAAVVRAEDPTRPVTAALRPIDPPKDNPTKEGLLAALVPMIRELDVAALNYQEYLYEDIRKALPEVVIIGAESFGYYRGEGLKFKSRNDQNPWFDVVKHDYVTGRFLWPGMDYLGESTGWPAKGRGDSPIETTGFRKPRSYWHESVWSSRPMVHIAVFDEKMEDYPQKITWHWPAQRSDWNPPREGAGSKLRLVTYSNCESVELLLNGRSLGRKRPADFKNLSVLWDVDYAPGHLQARGFNGEKVVATWELRTAGAPTRLTLVADQARLVRDGRDVLHVEVRVEDAAGVLVPDAAHAFTFKVSGPARLIGLDNGDLRSAESFKGSTRRAWRGRCLALIQAGRESCEIVLEVTAEGLPSARLVIR